MWIIIYLFIKFISLCCFSCFFFTEIQHLLLWKCTTLSCLVSFKYISVQLKCFESQLLLFLIKQPYALELNSLSCYIKFVDDLLPYKTQLLHISISLFRMNRWNTSAVPSYFLDLWLEFVKILCLLHVLYFFWLKIWFWLLSFLAADFMQLGPPFWLIKHNWNQQQFKMRRNGLWFHSFCDRSPQR